jgi:hypothetical protein
MCFAQKPLTFTKVIQKDGFTAQQLYDATKNWFVRTYVDSRAVLKYENSGKELTGNGNILFKTNMIFSSIEGHIKYLIDVQFKDGRLKLTLSDFRHDPIREALYNNHLGVLVDSLPKDLKEIGIEGANRKAGYKYFFKKGKPLCESAFEELSTSLEKFVDKREIETKDEW